MTRGTIDPRSAVPLYAQIAGRLKVAADGPAWASPLRWSEAEIVGRLAALLGPVQITGVVVRVVRG